MSAQESWEVPAAAQTVPQPTEALAVVTPLDITDAVATTAVKATVTSAESRGVTLIDHYFHDISLVPLLTREEEIDLGTRIQAGIAAEGEMGMVEPHATTIDTVLIRDIQQRIEDGQAAETHMIEANLRLVVWEAKRWANRGLSLKLGDLIQLGNLGLMHATRKYLPEKGTKFNTYAIPWIRQFIQRGIDNTARIVRFPVAAEEIRRSYNRFREDWEKEHGELPGDDDFVAYASDSMTDNNYELGMGIEDMQPALVLDAPLDESDSDSAAVGDRIAAVDVADTYREDLRAQGIRDEIASVVEACEVAETHKALYSLQAGIYLPSLEGKTLGFTDKEPVIYTRSLINPDGQTLSVVAGLFDLKSGTANEYIRKTRRAMKDVYDQRGGSAYL